jgi:integrase
MLSLYVTTLGEAGLRCDSEALHLRWEDVDLEEGFLWIASGRDGHRTKSGKGRWVPMTPKLRTAMKDHFAQFRFATYNGQRTPWVFHHTTTRRRATAGQRIGVLRRAFQNAVDRAKLPADLHQHDPRHRRGDNLAGSRGVTQ